MLLIERMVDWVLTIHELIGLFLLSATRRSFTPKDATMTQSEA
jgi:hypothetical protein